MNQAPYGEGWMIRMRANGPDPLAALLSSHEYERLLEEQHA